MAPKVQVCLWEQCIPRYSLLCYYTTERQLWTSNFNCADHNIQYIYTGIKVMQQLWCCSARITDSSVQQHLNMQHFENNYKVLKITGQYYKNLRASKTQWWRKQTIIKPQQMDPILHKTQTQMKHIFVITLALWSGILAADWPALKSGFRCAFPFINSKA